MKNASRIKRSLYISVYNRMMIQNGSVLLLLTAFLLLCGACVPNKKITYLQEGDELQERKEIVTDSVYRSHEMDVTEYRIQPLDNLFVRFETITDPEFDFFSRVNGQNMRNGGMSNGNNPNQGVLVDTDGMVEYPVIGQVKLAGLTVFEAQDTLQSLANNYLKDVVVRIRLQNFRFTVLGEVRGERVVTSNNTRITFMEAIGMSGGFGELADRSIVKVIRQKEDVSEVFYVNLLEEDFIESPNYYVQQNDIIIVPPLKQRTFKAYWTSNLGIIVTTVTSVLLIVNLFR